MGAWADTTFIRHDDPARVLDALRAAFAAEGMADVPPPAPRMPLLVEPMQYDDALHNDLWGIAAFVGAPGWVCVKTAPLSVLVERRPDGQPMRLASVCRALGVSAFSMHLRDGASLVIAEVDAAGDVLVSGFDPGAADPLVWHGQSVDPSRIAPAFSRHALDHLLAPGADAGTHALAVASALGGTNAALCDNATAVVSLVAHDPALACHARVAYFAWTGPSRQRFAACASWAEYRRAIGKGGES